jgi:predicted membrane protein (TIGR00267 family)
MDEAIHYHSRIDPHRRDSWLRDLILGGQDGLVNTLGVILGVAAASAESRLVLAAGLAATFAESISMAAVAYTSTQAERALYLSELERERRHVDRVPELEADEVREIFRKKGLAGELLEQVVAAITKDKEVWIALMMKEELELQPVEPRRAIGAALIVGLAALIGSLVPLVPFTALPIRTAMPVSIVAAALTLFATGAYKARRTVGHWLRSGLELATIGLASALIGWGVGWMFH